MSDSESTPLTSAPEPPRPNRLRRFFLRHVPLTLGGMLLLVILTCVGLYFWMSSAQFEGIVLRHLIAADEQATGGRVEIGSFHWRLIHLEAEADNLVIHGTEAPNEAPYLRIDHLAARVSILGFLTPSVRLNDLEIVHPVAHLIAYPDGTTNQPHPHKPSTSKSDTINTLFDLEAGHVSLQQGYIDYDGGLEVRRSLRKVLKNGLGGGRNTP